MIGRRRAEDKGSSACNYAHASSEKDRKTTHVWKDKEEFLWSIQDIHSCTNVRG